MIKEQEDLLKSTSWNVLIILDACRGDAYRKVVPSAEEVLVMSYKGCAATGHWMTRFNALYPGRLLYVVANPACSKLLEPWTPLPKDPELRGFRHEYCVLPLWKTLTGKYCPNGKEVVHPRSVYEALEAYLDEHGQPERMVVHMAQPHTPFIGKFQIKGGRYRQSQIYLAVHRGEVDIADCRRAYEANVDLAVEWAYKMLDLLKGTIVITADHGELLGERGFFGHSHKPLIPGLVHVPWDLHFRSTFEPADLPELPLDEDKTIEARLNALGYC